MNAEFVLFRKSVSFYGVAVKKIKKMNLLRKRLRIVKYLQQKHTLTTINR